MCNTIFSLHMIECTFREINSSIHQLNQAFSSYPKFCIPILSFCSINKKHVFRLSIKLYKESYKYYSLVFGCFRKMNEVENKIISSYK